MVDSHVRHANHALKFDRYNWAVTSLASDRIQVCCLEETHLEPIVPALTLIYIGNRCEGYITSTYIPSKTYFTSEMCTSSRCDFLSVLMLFIKI